MSININAVKESGSGIYLITNIVSGKKYVGSAVNVWRRWRHHRNDLRKSVHHSQIFQRSWNKYSEDDFKWEVLARCPKEYLIKLEQFFIDTIKPEYNINPTAGSNLGKKMSEEQKKKMSLAKKGQKQSATARKNQSNAHKESLRCRENLDKVHKSLRKAVYQYSLSGIFIREHKGIGEAARELGVSQAQIAKVVLGTKRRKTCGGFQFRLFYSQSIPAASELRKKVAIYKGDTLIGFYNSLTECSKSLHINQNCLSDHLLGKRTHSTVGGYTAKEISQDEYMALKRQANEY